MNDTENYAERQEPGSVLGAERLAELLIEISTGSAATKRRLRIELAGTQSSAQVARDVTKRLSSIERSRSMINWRPGEGLEERPGDTAARDR